MRLVFMANWGSEWSSHTIATQQSQGINESLEIEMFQATVTEVHDLVGESCGNGIGVVIDLHLDEILDSTVEVFRHVSISIDSGGAGNNVSN